MSFLLDEEVSTPQPRRRRAGKIFRRVMMLALLAFIGFGVYLDVFGHMERAQRAQAIVILGAGVTPRGMPGNSLRMRTLQAVSLYQRKYASFLICTGGLGDHPPTEAAAAASLAMSCRVPANVIFLEKTSTSTYENARNAAVICRKHGWKRVIVVSDPYHLWRARYLFAQEGIVAYPSPALACDHNKNILLRAVWTAREELAIVNDLLIHRR